MDVPVMFGRAVAEFDARVRQISDHQWQAATPDSGLTACHVQMRGPCSQPASAPLRLVLIPNGPWLSLPVSCDAHDPGTDPTPASASTVEVRLMADGDARQYAGVGHGGRDHAATPASQPCCGTG
jgi:hypothetical protein